MKEIKYKFSVIMPVYNVEKYLEDSILSVINQTIGFEENIQMILVNDGSTDNTKDICLKYKEKYSNNIEYIEQENQGVSSARNKGLEYAKGEYINFLDSDDIWDLNVFEKVDDFFKQHINEIDMVACRMKYFEGREGYHRLDYKFENNHIVDILKDYSEIQLNISSLFLKLKILNTKRFDTRLKYGEDATFIAQMLMEKQYYGILSDAIFNYRKRSDESSALQIMKYSKDWYFDTIEYGYKLLINKSIEKYGKVIPYIQYQIMHDIQWRIKVDTSLYLNEEEQKQYINNIIELLYYIDDNIIMEQKYLKKEYKILALCLKYKKDIRNDFYFEDGKIKFKDLNIYKIKNKSFLKIHKIYITNKNKENKINISGRITCFLPENDYNIFIKLDTDEKHKIKKYQTINQIDSILGKINNSKDFIISIPIKQDITDLRFVFNYKGNKKSLILYFDQLAKLSEVNEALYFIDKEFMISTEDNQIFVNKLDKQMIEEKDKKYKDILIENNKLDIILLRDKIIEKKRGIRKTYIKFIKNDMYVIKSFKKWKDKYINSNKWKKIEDVTLKKEQILNSTIIVGNEQDVKNIFGDEEEYIKDLYNFTYINLE